MNTSIGLYLNSVAEKLIRAGISSVSPYSPASLKLLYLYGYYHYLNCDDLHLQELQDAVFFEPSRKCLIGSIYQIDDEPIAYEAVIPLYVSANGKYDIDDIYQLAKSAITEFFNADTSNCSKREVAAVNKVGDASVVFKIVTNYSIDPSKKSEVKRTLAKLELGLENHSIEIAFLDDLLEEISDAEDPKKYVDEDFLVLDEPEHIAFHGQEHSFIASITAFSLRSLYQRTATKGLFASNLRYYVKSLKIDGSIQYTITKTPNDFWYLNNGIIITCEDYRIVDNKLLLKKFSIVNGGQTTNLIGNSDFDNDFSIVCKVIRERSSDASGDFLGLVAEASNTQKPIKAKDLIANRPEQKHLKSMMEDVSVFVQVKRGDRVNKTLYSQPWQQTTNDEIAQLLYSGIYQEPSFARNSVSKIFSTKEVYDAVFCKDYSPLFIKDLLIIRSAFQKWISPKRAHDQFSPKRIEVAKIGLLIYTAAICAMAKSLFNAKLKDCLREQEDTAVIQYFIGQRDIGFKSILNPSEDTDSQERKLIWLFSSIENDYVLDAYNEYQKYRIGQSGTAVNFVRDKNIYRQLIASKIVMDEYAETNNSGILQKPSFEDMAQTDKRFIPDYRPGLKIDLVSLRENLAKGMGVSPASVFDDAVLNQIVKNRPANLYELSILTKLKPTSIAVFGDDIVKTVVKYNELDRKR